MFWYTFHDRCCVSGFDPLLIETAWFFGKPSEETLELMDTVEEAINNEIEAYLYGYANYCNVWEFEDYIVKDGELVEPKVAVPLQFVVWSHNVPDHENEQYKKIVKVMEFVPIFNKNGRPDAHTSRILKEVIETLQRDHNIEVTIEQPQH